MRVPWTARRSNQSIIRKINPESSLEGLILKLKLQYFGHLMRGTDSFEKTVMLGKIEGRRRRRQQRMRWLNGITNLMESEKGGLTINIQKTMIMGSGSMRLWHRWGKHGNSGRF